MVVIEDVGPKILDHNLALLQHANLAAFLDRDGAGFDDAMVPFQIAESKI